MNTYRQADPEKKLFGIGLLVFGNGLIWFQSRGPGGIFTLHPLNLSDGGSRAEIVIGAMLAAFGILVWRNASYSGRAASTARARNASPASYVFAVSYASVLILCASKISEWGYFSRHQHGNSLSVDLEVAAVKLTIVICAALFGVWWADSTTMRERFSRICAIRRFVK